MAKTVVIVDGQKNSTLAKLTFDGKKIECDNEAFFEHLKSSLGSPNKDPEQFLERVMVRFRSGYLSAYQIGE